MSLLSNFQVKSDSRTGAPCESRRARPPEIHDALALVLGTGGAPAEAAQVLDFIEFAPTRGIDVRDLWVAGRGGRLEWAVLPIASPGKTLLLVTPGRLPAGLDGAAVVEGICHEFAGRGIHLAQVLLDRADAALTEFYERLGFCRMAELLYLHTNVGRFLPCPRLAVDREWRTYSDATHEMFSQAILGSYQQTLDCPSLNGMRAIEDVVAGHKASGEFDPRYWFVLRERDVTRAVLLLNRVPRTDTAELVYLGLPPESRGKGIGDLAMRQALWAVRQMNLSRLSLAVDANNEPALKLYDRHGLSRIGAKITLMRDLRRGRPA